MSDRHDEANLAAADAAPPDPRRARAMRLLVEELRAEEPPALPWDAIEARLMGEVERREADAARIDALRRVRRDPPALYRVFGFAAAAAAIALGITAASRGSAPVVTSTPDHAVDVAAAEPAPGAPGARGERDLLQLHVGDVIEAKAEAVTFSRAGTATWTLAPGGRVRVQSMGDAAGVGHTVALERGSIRAEVTPRDASEGLVEAFAVEVAGTRVAVHGTAFSVTRDEGSVTVDVEHGAVAVGPVGHVGATTGHLLIGPSRASFSLDGGRRSRLLARPADDAPKMAASQVNEAPAPIAGAVQPAPADLEPPAVAPQRPVAQLPVAGKPPAEPAVVPVVVAPPALLTADAVRSRLNACFKRVSEGSSSSLKVSVASTFKLKLAADGSIVAARFDPPLKVELQDCASGVMGGRFATGVTQIDIPVSFTP